MLRLHLRGRSHLRLAALCNTMRAGLGGGGHPRRASARRRRVWAAIWVCAMRDACIPGRTDTARSCARRRCTGALARGDVQWRLTRSTPATRRLGLALITRGCLLLAKIFLRDVVESILRRIRWPLLQLDCRRLLVCRLRLRLRLELRLELRMQSELRLGRRLFKLLLHQRELFNLFLLFGRRVLRNQRGHRLRGCVMLTGGHVPGASEVLGCGRV